jgi:deoxyribonuclease IV
MPLFGAHLSIAGGLPRAVDRAVATGCDVLQVFTKSVGQWRARALEDSEVTAFREAVARAGLRAVVAHASYLINVATRQPALRRQSIAALAEELDRAGRLGLVGLVFHPGAAADRDGVARVAHALARVLQTATAHDPLLVLEHTAGQGVSLGRTFEELAAIRAAVPAPLRPRVAVCLDTCHLLAAGYPIHTARGYRETMRAFDRVVGFAHLAVVHVNDSKRPCGSCIDRHAHIGDGCLGLETFGRLVNDRRFAHVPLILETPKTGGRPILADPLDLENLARLKDLVSATNVRGLALEPPQLERF